MKTHTASNLFRLSSSVACLLVASTVMAQGTNNAPPSSDVQGASSASPAAPPGQPAPPPPGSYPPAPAAYPPVRTRPSDIESPEPPEEGETHNPRTLAIGLTTLKEHGFGVMVRARANHVAGDLAVGFNPILVVGSGGSSAVDFGMPLQASIGPVFIFSNDQSTFQNGIRINGIYNRAVGPGGGLGPAGRAGWHVRAPTPGGSLQRRLGTAQTGPGNGRSVLSPRQHSGGLPSDLSMRELLGAVLTKKT